MTRAEKKLYPELGALSEALRRRAAGAIHPFAIPERSPAGAAGSRSRRPGAVDLVCRALRGPRRGAAKPLYWEDLQLGGEHQAVFRRDGACRRRRGWRSAPKPSSQRRRHRAVHRWSRKKQRSLGRARLIEHAKYGRGTVLRLEGSGEDTKVTVSFPGIRVEEIDCEICRNQDRMNTKKVTDKDERKKLKRAARKKAAAEGEARRRRRPRLAEAQSEEDGQGPA